MTETARLTYRELQRKFGLSSPDAARMRAKREAAKGNWRIIPGNHPQDPVHVEIPIADIPEAPPERPAPPSPPTPPGLPPAETVMEEALAFALERALERGADLADRLGNEKEAHGLTKVELAEAAARERALLAELSQVDKLYERAVDKMVKMRRASWWDRLWGVWS